MRAKKNNGSLLLKLGLVLAVLASSVAGLFVDSVLFLQLAFGGLDYLGGQIIGKAWMVLIALPLLVPWNVVGSMWNIMALPDIGLLGKGINALGIPFNYTRQPISAWFTVVLMDVWHWTSLVVLLCYAGLVAIPDAYYQAAKVDGANGLARLINITVPMLRPTTLFLAVIGIIGAFHLNAAG